LRVGCMEIVVAGVTVIRAVDSAGLDHFGKRLHILAAAGAALTLGEDHSATVALSQASETMDKIDLWHAKLAMKTLRKDQREAIAAAVES